MPPSRSLLAKRHPSLSSLTRTASCIHLKTIGINGSYSTFYPKDETPGCTTEACEFRDNIFAFKKINAQILGVSLDDVESHQKFAENHGLPFPLLADTEGKAAEAYGVKTKMFGMTVAKRQTFLIGPDGTIAMHYEKVKPDEHSAQVLADLRDLGATEN